MDFSTNLKIKSLNVVAADSHSSSAPPSKDGTGRGFSPCNIDTIFWNGKSQIRTHHMAHKFLQLQHSHYQLTSVQCDCLFGCCPITSQWLELHTQNVKLHNLQSGVTYVRSRVDSRKTWEVSREWRRGRRRMAWNLSHNAPITSTPLKSTFERHDHPGGHRHGIRWPWFLPL